ncbi:MAG: hypothetical protein GVY33_06505 [Alphaproteobacteria bacterium]|jgi:redox-sensitive bicupin YhaK (pirin superfamily)|nr:hypothetical protein [Alphaproteobacteria bacterium]
MSWQTYAEADCRFTAADIDPIESVVVPRAHDVGDLAGRCALPSRDGRPVGPFGGVDQRGPGEFRHRDGRGTALAIRPGAVDGTTADRGVADGERTPPAFARHPAEAMPLIQAERARARGVAGEPRGARSSVPTFGDMIDADLAVTAGAREARLMLLEGEPMGGPRYVWRNLVSSSRDRLEADEPTTPAGRFEAVAGEVAFRPRPDRPGR